MTSEEYIQLYQKYISGKCTPEEEQQLLEYKDSFRMQDAEAVDNPSKEDKALRKQIYGRIRNTISVKERPIISLWLRYAAAAVVILSIGVGLYITSSDVQKSKSEHIALKPLPLTSMDSSAAVLTLADGSVISLDETANGVLSHEGNTEIRKTEDGELVYGHSKELFKVSPSPNKIYIPKGNHYKLTLSDGTKVWLNSASTLTYPSNFSEDERNVELSGEGYFEVAKNALKPFTVTANGVKVRVLGTQFNVSAYNDDEFIKTTLAEGSVRLSNNNNTVVLKPGQQGVVKDNAEDIMVKKVNLQHALAWKEGYFLFKEDNIKDVMKQVSRWYNVKVEYEGIAVEDKVFGGIYAKSKKLEELLSGLELTGLVKFKIVESAQAGERRVVVMD